MGKTQTVKVKKKLWINIIAPRSLNEKVIGEAYVAESSLLVDRVVSCNLMSLTNNMKNQNAVMKFSIIGIRDGKAHTRPISFELNPTFIKRMMRRKKNRVDESIALKTADDKNIRIKLFLLINSRAKSFAVAKLRAKIREETKNLVNKSKYDELFNGVIMHRVQSRLRGLLNKIVPLKVCEVRVLKEEKEKRKIGEKQTIEKAPEEIEIKVKEAPKEEVKEEKKEEEPKVKKEEAPKVKKTENKKETPEVKEDKPKKEDKKEEPKKVEKKE